MEEAVERGSTRPGRGRAGGTRTAPAVPGAGTAPVPARPDRRTGLRAVPSSFVGRRREVRQVVGLLRSARLVTLTGPTGIGKTRLALEVAGAVAGGYAAGARLVELAEATGPGVALALARAVGVQEQAGRSLVESVATALAPLELLLVVDNCEHVVEAAAGALEALLAACPRLSVLATSQERLAISGEQAWPVPPLSTPAAGRDRCAPGVAARHEAVELFCDRARGVNAGFRLTAATAPHVADVCRRLDGLPLAIELAASQAGVLSPAEIAAGIDDRFGLLTGGRRTLLARHRTLLSAVRWSHDLLDEPERAVLRRMTVFSGGATLAALRAVATGGEVAPVDVRRLVGALVDKSLVVADTSRTEARFRLLETIGHFAADRLAEAGEDRAAHDLHLEYFVALAEASEPELTGPDQGLVLERLQAEHANLRAALEWAVATGNHESALRLAGSLTLFWRVRGYFSEGRDWLEAASRAAADVPPGVEARALWGAGFLTFMADDTAAAEPLLRRGLELSERSGDARMRARSLLLLGNCAQSSGELGDPVPLLEQAIDAARQADDPWCLAHALALAAQSHIRAGQRDSARRMLAECVEVAERSGDRQSLRIGYIVAGSLALAEGDYEAAERHLGAGRAVVEELGETYGTWVALANLAELALGRGRYDEAERLATGALEVAHRPGAGNGAAAVTCLLARVALARDDLGRAADLIEQVRAQEGPGGPTPAALLVAGTVALRRGRADEAAEAFGRAQSGAASNLHDGLRATAGLADVAAARRDLVVARALHDRALEGRHRLGALPEAVGSLEALAAVLARDGSPTKAARILGAAGAAREARGYARHPWEERVHEQVMAALSADLGREALDAALAQGASMPLAGAVAYARRSRGPRPRASEGWASLTNAEAEVARLVAANLTNQEIADRLFVSVPTVKTHLSRVFSKLGVRRRRQVVRSLPPGLAPPGPEPPVESA